MPVYITDIGFATSQASPYSSYIEPNSPRVGILNYASKLNVVSSEFTSPLNPEWLATLPNTDERWISINSTEHQFIYNSSSGEVEVDYIAFAAHSGLVGGQVEIELKLGSDTVKEEGPFSVISSDPVMFLFDPVDCDTVIIKFSAAASFTLSVGHISVGLSVALPRKIYVGHSPIPYSQDVSTRFEVSDNGNFLGQELNKSLKKSSVSISNIPPDYYRDIIYPRFSQPAKTLPFYWAWRPAQYPKEVGFCWLPTGNVNASNQSPNGFMQLSFDLVGHVND